MSYIELPGYNQPSIEDLKVEVVLFERRVKDYAVSVGLSLQKNNSDDKRLYDIVNELTNLNPYPEIDEDNEAWSRHIEELHKLRKFRNDIIHINDATLPSLEDLYKRYKSANEKLIPFTLNAGCTESVFEPIKWNNNTLEIKINGNVYHLTLADIDNLSIQLHPATRGGVFYKEGKQVVAKVTDYEYKYLTVFIENNLKFNITIDEAAVLDDLILTLKDQRLSGA